MIKCENNSYIHRFYIDISCNQDVNGEHRLLKKIIDSCTEPVHIFDVGARNSKYPNYTDTHKLHLFDPDFKYEPGVNYEKTNVVLNKKALNSTDYTLDSYCKANGIEEIEFLKIDTDGYDVDVLKGATEILKRVKYIQVEYDMFALIKGQSADEVENILRGRKLYKITPFGLEPKDHITRNFIYSNYLFTNEDISYEPYTLDAEFFQGIFWEDDPKAIESAYNNCEIVFHTCETDTHVSDETLLRYYSNYLPHIVTEYKKNV